MQLLHAARLGSIVIALLYCDHNAIILLKNLLMLASNDWRRRLADFRILITILTGKYKSKLIVFSQSIGRAACSRALSVQKFPLNKYCFRTYGFSLLNEFFLTFSYSIPMRTFNLKPNIIR
jgi:hypothetical protein